MRSAHTIIAVLLLASALLFAAAPARAQVQGTPEAAQGSFPYRQPGCEFEIVFPKAPYTTRRCNPELPDNCELMTSYTQVFDLSATLNFYVSCKPVEESVASQFTQDIMQTPLLARAGASRLQTQETAYDQNDNARMAALLGAGKAGSGNGDLLYVSQIWVGKKSIMTIEGELIGSANDEADIMFADILRTARFIPADGAAASPPPAEKGEDKAGDNSGDNSGDKTKENAPAGAPESEKPAGD